MSGNLRVSCRIRPCSESELKLSAGSAQQQPCVKVGNDLQSVTFSHGGAVEQEFHFDHVFAPEASQENIYGLVGRPLVEDTLAGYNCTLFAYGQTGSGKTHTVVGDPADPVQKGVVPRAIEELMARIRAVECSDSRIESTITVSFMEIYLEKIRDLLKPSNKDLRVREDADKGVWVQGATELRCHSAQSILDAMIAGLCNRTVGSHQMNAESSRSHSIFIIVVTQHNLETSVKKTGKLFLVDLAGSEMVRKTNATGQRLEEAKHINKSLTALGMVITALTDGESRHIPYRDSKLTRILQDSLGGNSKTHLVVTCSPSACNLEETLSTVRFGTRAKKICNKPRVNQQKTIGQYKAILADMERRMEALLTYVSSLESQQILGHSDDKSVVGHSDFGVQADATSILQECKKAKALVFSSSALTVGTYEASVKAFKNGKTEGRRTPNGQLETLESIRESCHVCKRSRIVKELDNGKHSPQNCEEGTSQLALFVCDGNCGKYYHPACVGLTEPPQDAEWYCAECQSTFEHRIQTESIDLLSVEAGDRTPLTSACIQTPRSSADAVVREHIEILKAQLLSAKREKDRSEARREAEESLYKSIDMVGEGSRRKLAEQAAKLELLLTEKSGQTDLLREALLRSERSLEIVKTETAEKLRHLKLALEQARIESTNSQAEACSLRKALDRMEKLSEDRASCAANSERTIQEIERSSSAKDECIKSLQLELVAAQAEISKLRTNGAPVGKIMTQIRPATSDPQSRSPSAQSRKSVERKAAIQIWWNGKDNREAERSPEEESLAGTRTDQSSGQPKHLEEGCSNDESLHLQFATGHHGPRESDQNSHSYRPFKARLEGLLSTIEAERDSYKDLRERMTADLKNRREKQDVHRATNTSLLKPLRQRSQKLASAVNTDACDVTDLSVIDGDQGNELRLPINSVCTTPTNYSPVSTPRTSAVKQKSRLVLEPVQASSTPRIHT